MKYWYLEKYKHIKVTELNLLKNDLKFFFCIKKITKKEGEALLLIDINLLKEEELIILLHYIIYYKKSSLNKIVLIINKLLEIPDNSMPTTDYTLSEMLEEIKNLSGNRPYKEKIQNNNIAACYNCLNVFYVDKISYINKRNICLCPFCKSTNLYFDNDYIPMNYYFLKLAKLYYKQTPLGCNFKNIQKLLKNFDFFKETSESIVLNTKIFKNTKALSSNKKVTSFEEEKLLYTYYNVLNNYDLTYNFNLTIEVPSLEDKNKFTFGIFLIVFLAESFGENPYLKKVFLSFKTAGDSIFYKKLFKTFITFS